jgi:hypothetical protein
MNLFEIDKGLLEYLDKGLELCVNEDGEVDEEKLSKYLEILPEEREHKLEAYGLVIKQKVAEMNALASEISNLTARLKAKDKQVERLKKAVTTSMTAFNEKEFETARVCFKFRKSESVEVDIEKLDKSFIKEVVDYKADKTAIKQAIKNGETITGAELVVKQNLQVK